VDASPGMSHTPHDSPVRVYLWVSDHVQDQAVHDFCVSNHGTIQEIAGTGTLTGSGSRAAAQKIFDHHIASYEQARHRTLSKLLWSRKLHDLGLGGVLPPRAGWTDF